VWLHNVASDISCSQSQFHLIFGYVVSRIKHHRSTKDEVKPRARTQYITCRVDSITLQVIFHAPNVCFTSSLDMLFVVSSVTKVPKMKWNRQWELDILCAKGMALRGKWYFMLTMSVSPHLWICCLAYPASHNYQRWGESDSDNWIYDHVLSGRHYATSNISCSQCRFHLIFHFWYKY
jgi:hypothetical protein